MATDDADETGDPVRTAWRELQSTISNARTELDRVRSRPVLNAEERRELHWQALSGVLGRDMQALARHVDAGETSWGEVFEGSSEYSHLLEEHVSRMANEHADDVRRALEEDEEFDPMASSPNV
jgi:hypothetical protein